MGRSPTSDLRIPHSPFKCPLSRFYLTFPPSQPLTFPPSILPSILCLLTSAFRSLPGRRLRFRRPGLPPRRSGLKSCRRQGPKGSRAKGNGPGKAKAEIAVAAVGRVVEAERRPAVVRIVVPAAAADDAVSAPFWTFGVHRQAT